MVQEEQPAVLILAEDPIKKLVFEVEESRKTLHAMIEADDPAYVEFAVQHKQLVASVPQRAKDASIAGIASGISAILWKRLVTDSITETVHNGYVRKLKRVIAETLDRAKDHMI